MSAKWIDCEEGEVPFHFTDAHQLAIFPLQPRVALRIMTHLHLERAFGTKNSQSLPSGKLSLGR